MNVAGGPMKHVVFFSSLLFTLYSIADDKKPQSKLNISTHNCTSPCEVTLDGSSSKAGAGKTIKKYIFEYGNGEKIETENPKVTFVYYNYIEGNNPKDNGKYKKLRKYIEWSYEKFRHLEKFEPTLKIVQSDNSVSNDSKQTLIVKGSDVLPSIDSDDVVPPKPNQEISDSTLMGVDLDSDLVRDDVELWINQKFNTIERRKSLKQYAKSLQQTFININNVDLAREAVKKELDASGCLDFVLNGNLTLSNHISKSLEVEFFNTKERLEAEIKIRKYLNGISKSFYDPNATPDKDKCEF
jgi:hypothetical protein